MKVLSVFVFSLLLAGCTGTADRKEDASPEPVISKEVIKHFVLNSEGLFLERRLLKLDSMLATLSKDSVAFRKTILLLQEPLSHPNSRYRNEDLYIKLLQAQLNSPWYIDAEKEAAKNKLQLVMQNRKGNPANDFTYITPGGLKKRMYAINADHLILFFYNPECQACKEMKEALERSELVKSKLKNKKLKILAVYIDKDEALWRKHLNEMPQQWVVGRDEDEFLYRNNVYDLKAIPTVYLLTKEKKVLLKDCMDLSLIEKNLDSKTED